MTEIWILNRVVKSLPLCCGEWQSFFDPVWIFQWNVPYDDCQFKKIISQHSQKSIKYKPVKKDNHKDDTAKRRRQIDVVLLNANQKPPKKPWRTDSVIPQITLFSYNCSCKYGLIVCDFLFFLNPFSEARWQISVLVTYIEEMMEFYTKLKGVSLVSL